MDAARAYSYLLGMYLGDGHIARAKKSHRLQIYLHREQRAVIERVVRAIQTVRPDRPIALVRHGPGATAVSVYSAAWPWLFPQHGPGPKHARPIKLEWWQSEVVTRHPEEFLRGLIESDGCRHRRIVNGKNYPAYGFCSHSRDILELFMAACDLVGLHYTTPTAIRVSIARRPDVARLDAMFGRQEPPLGDDGLPPQ